MIRIIFDNGEIADCEHIEKMYIEEYEMDKVTMVGNIKSLEENDVRNNNRGTEKSNTDIESQTSISRRVNQNICSNDQKL